LGNVFISARVLGLHKKIFARAGFGLSASGGELAWSQPREAGCWSYKRIPHVSDRVYDDYYDILVSIPYRAGMENY